MAFAITITDDAERQLRALSARERRVIEAAVHAQLRERPTTPTRAIRLLRPNPFAQFELRVGDLRVLYNVEGAEVVLLLIGRKIGNRLIVDDEEFHDHQDHSTE